MALCWIYPSHRLGESHEKETLISEYADPELDTPKRHFFRPSSLPERELHRLKRIPLSLPICSFEDNPTIPLNLLSVTPLDFSGSPSLTTVS